jgi:hypothetical protein
MTPSKLQTIADGMRASVSQYSTGWTAATLPHGLELVLSHQAEMWRFALRRGRGFSSGTEGLVLAEGFGVPDGVESARRRSWKDTHPKSKQPIIWCVIELTWREVVSQAA